MIGYLTGTIVFKTSRTVVVDVGGVGYEVEVASSLLQSLGMGDIAKLWTHLYVREDALSLYGFLHRPELEFFQMLIAISGIGPRSAMGVLGVASVDTLKKAIAAGETAYLTKVSGIGRKMAEKIIMELKERLGAQGVEGDSALRGDADVLEALIGLGYSSGEARKAIISLPPEVTSRENRLKEALKIISTQHH